MTNSNRTVVSCCILSALLLVCAILWIGNSFTASARRYLSESLQRKKESAQRETAIPGDFALRQRANDLIYGVDGKIDIPAARTLLLEGYAQGDRYAGMRLCMMDTLPAPGFDWDEHERRYNDCIEAVMDAADAGNNEARHLYALCLYYSEPEFEVQAASYAERAANEGLHSAELLMGTFCEEGSGGAAKDLQQAANYYGLAIEDGNVLAEGYLGALLTRVDWEGSEPQRGLSLLESAGSKGDEYSLLRLGEIYEVGELGETDPEKALGFYLHSAELGCVEAMYSAGLMHEEGRGITRDRAEAVRWYRMAAEYFDSAAVDRLVALGETTLQYDWYSEGQ